jgi:hypothetical protein
MRYIQIVQYDEGKIELISCDDKNMSCPVIEPYHNLQSAFADAKRWMEKK